MPERRTLRRSFAGSSLDKRGGATEQQLSRERHAGSAKAIGEKPEVTDAHEPSGEHVQKEAAQELVGGQRHRALLAAVGIVLPAEGDALRSKANKR